MENYKETYNGIINKINEASMRGNKQDVTLIAVTKTRSVEEINKMIEAGATDIGENKVQEIRDKYEHILPVKWHMIGHLQTNKVKYIIDKVDMIHSVDSIKLVEEIDKRAKVHSKIMDILVQINVAEEESKFGISADEASRFISKAKGYKNINVKGIMVIAPFDNPESVRKYFRKAYEIFTELKSQEGHATDMDYISMALSNDYEVAIEEGSNMVRVGTALFGQRNYG